jgi:PAS domain S-box-containing protein
MIGLFITESLLKHEYATIENFLYQWGRENDDIVEIRATAPNNFVLMQYRSITPALHVLSQEKHVEYSGKGLLVLNVKRDFTSEERILRNLQLQLITGSVLITIILGTVLWFTIRRLAFKPLETEIEVRKRAEEMLERVKDDLAMKVQERTRELSDINENLLLEITEREKAEEKLRESEQYLQTIIRTEPDCVKVITFDGTLVTMNSAGLAMIEADSLEQVAGQKVYPLILPEYRDVFRELIESVFSGNSGILEFEIVGRKGTRRRLETHAVPMRDTKNNIIGLLGVTRDITEHKHALDALRLSEEKFSKAFRSGPTLMAISILRDGRFVDANYAFLNAFGYTREEVLGHTSFELGIWDKYPDRDNMLQQLKKQGIVQNLEAVLCKKNGDTITVLLSAEMINIENESCIIVVGLDISERKKLEAQLLHAQKMEAVGQLAGGVAHDFNNILTAVINNCYLLKKSIGEDGKEGEYIDKILALSNNAAKITRELLIFSRKQFFEPLKVDLNDIVRNARDFMKNFLREDIELKTVFAEAALPIMADRNQIEQIMMNLATNARDAIPDVGKLTIETELVGINESFIKTRGIGAPGMYALLSVTDTGTGMDEDTKQKIFEPFFTTKEVGKGTGLGLAIVYGIVRQHNGFIDVYSDHEKGTTFRIYFPVIQTVNEADKSVEYSELMGKGETILFAEDEPAVRESIKIIFKEFNYRIIEAVDGQDAVEKFLVHKEDIKLLVFDVVMPRKSGKKAFDEIREIKPGIKVIFTSGYAGDKISEEETEEDGVVFISKPLMPEKLLSKVRELLQ